MGAQQVIKGEVPTARDAELARQSQRLLAACLGSGEAARVKVIDGDCEMVVPVAALRAFVDILGQMAEGNAVNLVPINAMFTTQQAADYLNVSRPHVVKLLAEGAIPHVKVGTHRRIAFADLREYREKLMQRALAAADALTAGAQALGLED